MSLQITMNKKTHDIHMVMSRASIPFVFNSYHFYQLFFLFQPFYTTAIIVSQIDTDMFILYVQLF